MGREEPRRAGVGARHECELGSGACGNSWFRVRLRPVCLQQLTGQDDARCGGMDKTIEGRRVRNKRRKHVA